MAVRQSSCFDGSLRAMLQFAQAWSQVEWPRKPYSQTTVILYVAARSYDARDLPAIGLSQCFLYNKPDLDRKLLFTQLFLLSHMRRYYNLCLPAIRNRKKSQFLASQLFKITIGSFSGQRMVLVGRKVIFPWYVVYAGQLYDRRS